MYQAIRLSVILLLSSILIFTFPQTNIAQEPINEIDPDNINFDNQFITPEIENGDRIDNWFDIISSEDLSVLGSLSIALIDATIPDHLYDEPTWIFLPEDVNPLNITISGQQSFHAATAFGYNWIEPDNFASDYCSGLFDFSVWDVIEWIFDQIDDEPDLIADLESILQTIINVGGVVSAYDDIYPSADFSYRPTFTYLNNNISTLAQGDIGIVHVDIPQWQITEFHGGLTGLIGGIISLEVASHIRNPFVSYPAQLAAALTIVGSCVFIDRADDYDLETIEPTETPEPIPLVDLAISAVVTDTIIAGSELVYTFVVENYLNYPVTGVQLTSQLPAGTSYVGFTTNIGSCSGSGADVTCNLGNLYGADASIQVTVSVPSTITGELVSITTVNGNETDSNVGNNTVTTVTNALDQANRDPVAIDDFATTTSGVTVSIPVLANDQEPDGNPMEVYSVGVPINGVASTNGILISYTPNVGFVGVDTFTYILSDTYGGGAEATVTVTVNEPVCIPNPASDLVSAYINGNIAGVTNISTACTYTIGLASYLMVDDVIDNQILLDSTSSNIAPQESIELSVNLPDCAYQIDLFYGDLLVSLNGVRYGERLLAGLQVIDNGNWCVSETPVADNSSDMGNEDTPPEEDDESIIDENEVIEENSEEGENTP